MRRILIFCVAVSLAACVAVGGVAAQDDEPGLETNTSVNVGEPETYAQEIDAETRLVEWSYDRDREGFRLLFETDDSTRITLTEAVQFGEGSGSGRIYQHRLPEGQTEVFVSVPLRAGQAAVTMTTPGSIANNRFAYVSTGQTTPDRPPISYERAQILILLSGVGGAGLTYRVVRQRREDEEKSVERVL
ncbi:hypothetical protein C464_12010 [Halorubrum coriense DSM 10284]|uniref:Lipoprotein n=1 Tax=Halorubrum coriense DSM 10284 TaxID=1227466 RepID=M0EFH5_9EURY|nr:hypothetical protein [Halorubrum coriense]ELZ45642.1 hypothetical protein C464_12010 [Halorubrum coriense DSM 10284]